MSDDDLMVEGHGERLAAHFVRPPGVARVPGLVLCHGFPHGPGGALTAGQTYPALADRLMKEVGWAVVSFNFRGAGRSSGDFSISGWVDDVATMVDHLDARPDITGVWVAGSSTGGAVALVHAARDERVRGIATFAAPSTLRPWVENAPRFLEHARRLGVIRREEFPPDLAAWAREIAQFDPVAAARRIPPRPFMILHGAGDDTVAPSHAERLAEAAGGQVEYRLLGAAGHRLRHDPRVVALLAGWLSRQSP